MTDLRETGEVADAVPGNWVDRVAPPAARPWLRLSRADRPAGTWLLLIPCLWAIALGAVQSGWRPFDLWLMLGCGAGAFLMRGAGCTWNDVTDRDIDGAVARTRSRPIPSGQVGVRGALGWMAAQAMLAFGILLTFPAAAIWLGIASLLPVAVYPFAKRFTWWPQVFLGVAFNWGALLAWAAHAGHLPGAALPLYAGGIAWTLFYDTIYAYQDLEDDALIGVRSTARRFGDRPGPWLAAFAGSATAGMAVSVALAAEGTALWIALAGVVAFGAHLAWQFVRLDHRDGTACLTLFRSNRDAGLLPLPFFAAAGFG